MNGKKNKVLAPVIVTTVWKYALAVIPLVFSAIMVKVCIERIHEIKEGEEDDIGKY